MNDTITPKTFLSHVFPRALVGSDEAPCIAHPAQFVSRETLKPVDYYKQFHWHGRKRVPTGKATYYCVSTVTLQTGKQIKKRLQDGRTAFVVPCDDVGTKSKEPPLAPSYVLETSPGNHQWGYFIDPWDVTTGAGQMAYDAVLYSLAEAGYNDPGCRSASRLLRLPGSVHRTGFESRIVEWQPENIYSLNELPAQMGITLAKPRKAFALRPGEHERLELVTDPLYHWMADGNWEIYGHNETWVHIECPWRAEHTDGNQGPSSTAFSPDGYGTAGRGFSCLHGHCARRGLAEFLAAMGQLGAEIHG